MKVTAMIPMMTKAATGQEALHIVVTADQTAELVHEDALIPALNQIVHCQIMIPKIQIEIVKYWETFLTIFSLWEKISKALGVLWCIEIRGT